MGLTAEIIDKNKRREKRYAISDGRGLLLEIHPTGKKSWIVRYFVKNKEHRKQVGTFPTVGIKEAREMAQRIQRQAKRGLFTIDPNAPDKLTFYVMAEEWLSVKIKPLSARHFDKTQCRLKHLYGAIGDMELKDIAPMHILSLCRELEKEQIDKKTGKRIPPRPDTAHRVRAVASQVFAFAIQSDKAKNNPAVELKGALTPHKEKHYATITKESEIAELMRAIDNYPRKITRLALLFSALTFCRPGEIRHAEWSEIDWEVKEWQIPAEKMKAKRIHIVPLSTQAIELLRELETLTNCNGVGKWLFPSERNDGRPMSDNTIRTALRFLGYSNEEMTPHGFRAMASTTLNRRKYHSDYIERQLAHIEKDTVRDAYNHYDFIDERREMIQHYADYLWKLIIFRNKGEELAELLKSDKERRFDNDEFLSIERS